jgi:putative endonuclease
MSYFTYLVLFENGYLYTGSTANIFRRTREHFRGGGRPTVIWRQRFESREEALAREKQLKGWSRAKKLALAEGRVEDLVRLAKRRGGRSKG